MRRVMSLVAVSSLTLLGLSVFLAPYRFVLAALALLLMSLALGLGTVSRRDGAAFLTLMVALLFLIPENLVLVGPLKSVGNPAQLTGLFCLAVWAAARLLGLLRARQGHPVRWIALLFAMVTMTAFVAGQLRPTTVEESASLNRTVFLLSSCLGILLLAVDGLDDRRRLEQLVVRVVGFGGLAALIGLMEFVSTFSYRTSFSLPGLTTAVEIAEETRGDFSRISGAAAHPIEYAVALAALTPLALHLALNGRTRGTRQTCAAAFLAMVLVVPLSLSRAGLLAEVIGLGVYAVHLSYRARLNFLVLAVIGLALFRSAVPGLLGTIRYLFSAGEQDSSISARTNDYALIPELMDGRWWFGRGLGTFVPTQYFYLDNQYLGSLLEGGIAALLVFTALWVTGACVARGARHRSGDPRERGLAQALAGSIVALGFAAVAFDELSFRQTSFTLFLLVGVAGALWSVNRDLPRRFPSGEVREPDPVPVVGTPS